LGDDLRTAPRDNRFVVPAVADVVSPELVLVSPPEDAARARRVLRDPVHTVPRSGPAPAGHGSALFYAACIAGTLGPLLLAVVAR
jgi:hypothetical protein